MEIPNLHVHVISRPDLTRLPLFEKAIQYDLPAMGVLLWCNFPTRPFPFGGPPASPRPAYRSTQAQPQPSYHSALQPSPGPPRDS